MGQSQQQLQRFTVGLGAMALLGGMTGVAQAQLAPALTDSLKLTIGPNFSPDPTDLGGLSGGSTAAGAIADRKETANGPCVGFVERQPNHTLVLTEFFDYLSLQVQSPEDTTMVIQGPGGTWCNDDNIGKNPGIAGQWLAGTYKIWIGSYNKTNYSPYILRITSKRS